MNDDELITLMKEPFAGVRMTMPLDQVVRHGRAVRTRRRLRGLTGAVALAGSVTAAVALLPAGGQAHPVPGGITGTPQLAAWTVTRDPDGGITVTVNQMRDPAGLQATLRADGIPARVTFDPVHAMTQPLPAGCTAPKLPDRANAQLQDKILVPPAIWSWQQQLQRRVMATPIRLTYTMNGHVRQVTVPRGGSAWYHKWQQLRKEGAQNITITGLGVPAVMPDNLQKVAAAEEDDVTGRSALYINPAAIPAGIGLSIGVDVVSQNNFGYGVDLVVASAQCTGS